MTLETPRMYLRPWSPEDAPDLFKYAKDPRVGPITGWPPHKSVEESRRIIAGVLSVGENFALVLKETDSPVGCIGLNFGKSSGFDIPDDEALLGFWLGVPFWGQGLMPEAAKEILRYGFTDKKLSKIWSGYYDGNDKSKRVQEKCGFRFHHTIAQKPVPLLNETRTEHVTLITKQEWEKSAVS